MTRFPPPYEEVAAIVAGWPGRRGYGPAIAARFGVSQDTARRWVMQARRLGLLPDGTAERVCPRCGGTGVTRWVPHPRRSSG